MKKLLPLFFSIFCFAEDITTLYKQAQDYENKEDYKNAMLIYKKIANLNLTKEDKYIIDLSKQDNYKVETFTDMKKSFYNHQIEKLEDKESNDTIKQMIVGNFGLYPYEKNYILPITYDLNKTTDRNQFETTYQISVEKPISYNFFGLNESISAAYTQSSFWQTSEDSSPFRETNYRPEIFIMFPYKNSERLKGLKFSLLHESNGRNNENSRSWNRLYAQAFLQLSNLFVIPRVWYRLPEKTGDDDNPDILDYYGYGDLTLLYAYKKHTFELKLRDNLEFDKDNKGSAEFNWTFPLPNFLSTSNNYGMFHIFSGYGNNLIDYDREIHRIGIGFAFSR